MKNSNRQRVCFNDKITVMCDYKSERKFLSYSHSPSYSSEKSLKSRTTGHSTFAGRIRPRSPVVDYPPPSPKVDYEPKFIPISSVTAFSELNPAYHDEFNNRQKEEIHLAVNSVGHNWASRFTPYSRTFEEIFDSRPYQTESDITRQLAIYRIEEAKAKRRRLWLRITLISLTIVTLSVGIGLTVYYD